jgi:hypothetical protein
MRNVGLWLLCLSASLGAHAVDDDAHNHDGSHPDGPQNCGGNYMLPGAIARLGSHSFMILGAEDESHIIAEHRSGTPPHNYQFLLRVRLDPPEMRAYRELLKDARTLPAFTTIYFDAQGQQQDRTFFCLPDLPKIFGPQKQPGDAFAKLFPIRASLQRNPDHEGSFEIEKSVARGQFITLERDDVELLVYRYLPAYLPQDLLRAALKKDGAQIRPLLTHAPITADESPTTAAHRASYMASDGRHGTGPADCPHNFYLKSTPVARTVHSFLLLAEAGPHAVLATHYYDYAPQNFQTVVRFRLSDDAMKIYRRARQGAATPPLFQTAEAFCMENIRTLGRDGKFTLTGTVYRNPTLNEYRRGSPVGKWALRGSDLEVLVNRRLESFLNPLEVQASVNSGE